MQDFIKQILTPTESLRVCINLGNAVLAQQEKGELKGISVDLAKKLAEQLQVETQFIIVKNASLSVEAISSGEADIGFFAIDPQRAEVIQFSQPYLSIYGSYLVHRSSPIQHISEVDNKANRIVVARGSAYDLYLSRHLKQAQLIHTQTSQEVVDIFLAGHYEVAAGIHQQLSADAQRVQDVRLLPGHFMEIQQAMGVAKKTDAKVVDYLNLFLAQQHTGIEL